MSLSTSATTLGMVAVSSAVIGRFQDHQNGKPIRPCVKHNDGDRASCEVLLEGEVSIDRYEHVTAARQAPVARHS
ncbi:MAG: hypothetical protein WCB02_26410 [Bradyrhizobium sp.]